MLTGWLNQRIHECFASLVKEGIEITPATVMKHFETNHGKAPADLLVYLTDCAATVEFEIPETVYELCKIVSDHYYVSAIRSHMSRAQTMEHVLEIAAKAFSIAPDRFRSQRPTQKIIDEIFETQDAIDEGRVEAGYSWGIGGLDDILRIRPGCLYVIGALKKSGKSLFLIQTIDENINPGPGGIRTPVLFFSCEMADTEVYLRILSRRAYVDSRRIHTKYLGHEDRQRIFEVSEGLKYANLVVDDAAGLSIRDLVIRSRLWKREVDVVDKTGIIAVDFIQLIQAVKERPGMSRAEELTQIAYALASLAKDLKVAVIALAQLRNEAEGEEPQVRHLEGSGGIAQAAEAILLLDLVSRRDPETHPFMGVQPIRVIVGAQRRGESGVVCHLQTKLSVGRFYEEARP